MTPCQNPAGREQFVFRVRSGDTERICHSGVTPHRPFRLVNWGGRAFALYKSDSFTACRRRQCSRSFFPKNRLNVW